MDTGKAKKTGIVGNYVFTIIACILSHTSVYCSKPVQALLSLLAQSFPAAFFVAVYHAWFEALSLSALLVLSFTPELLTLFTALSFSSLESS